MTLKQMATLLERWRQQHGDDVPVYFDCPHCNVSFTPGVLASTTVVIKAHAGLAPPAPEGK